LSSAEEDSLLAAALHGVAAIAANDVPRIAAYLSEDWVIVSESGISDRDSFLALVESGELSHSAMDVVGEPRVRILGDVGIVTGRVTNTAFYGGRRFDADEWTTDVFVRQAGRWRCVHSHITSAGGPAPQR
jgi:ketosteroid isomerase-like protein